MTNALRDGLIAPQPVQIQPIDRTGMLKRMAADAQRQGNFAVSQGIDSLMDRYPNGLPKQLPRDEESYLNSLMEQLGGQGAGKPRRKALKVSDASPVFSTSRDRPDVSGDAPTMRKIQQEELSLRNALNNLSTVFEQLQENPGLLDDAHTTIGSMRTGALAARDRLGIDAFDISPEQERRVGDVAQYRQRLLTNVNNYIKEITGATVGQGDETTRLMAVQPNASDSPSQVVAKLQGAMDMARLEIARRRLMAQSGMDNAPTDTELRELLLQRGQDYLREAQRQGLSGNEARMWAADKMSEEFGF